MHDRRGSVAREHLIKAIPVKDITFDQGSPLDGPFVTMNQAVVGNRFEAACGKRFARVGANIPRTAGYQYVRH
jgi:ABC-type dipeptide/oligopeptide/nickel transport system ATPase component